jgi:hypothetical protein
MRIRGLALCATDVVLCVAPDLLAQSGAVVSRAKGVIAGLDGIGLPFFSLTVTCEGRPALARGDTDGSFVIESTFSGDCDATIVVAGERFRHKLKLAAGESYLGRIDLPINVIIDAVDPRFLPKPREEVQAESTRVNELRALPTLRPPIDPTLFWPPDALIPPKLASRAARVNKRANSAK